MSNSNSSDSNNITNCQLFGLWDLEFEFELVGERRGEWQLR